MPTGRGVLNCLIYFARHCALASLREIHSLNCDPSREGAEPQRKESTTCPEGENFQPISDSIDPFQERRSDAVWRGGTGVPPVNHAQDARATLKLHQYPRTPIT